MKIKAQMAPQFELISMVTYFCQYVCHTINNKNIKQYKTSLFFSSICLTQFITRTFKFFYTFILE